MGNIATFVYTEEGYTDYSNSEVFPRHDDYQNPNPLPLHLLPSGPIKIIKKKISSYKSQDKNNKKINMMRGGAAEDNLCLSIMLPDNYVDLNDVIELIKIQDGRCYICKEYVLFNYKKYCNNQFTLDRINNTNPHLRGNVLIACNYCNVLISQRGSSRRLSRSCRNKCCKDKSEDIKKLVPQKEIEKLLSQYNKSIGVKYSPNDEWIDYNRQYDYNITEENYTQLSFCTKKAGDDYLNTQQEDYGNRMETYYPGYKKMSRRERKNLIDPDDSIWE